MKQLKVPFRDIFVGQVAAELKAAGYFGEELDIYGFYTENTEMNSSLSLNEELIAQTFTSEEACVREMLRHWEQGAIISDYEFVKTRVYAEEDIAHAYEALTDKLLERQADVFRCRMKDRDNGNASQNEVTKAFQAKWQSLHKAEMQEGRILYGFLFDADGEVKCYVNAFLPQTWQKWRKERSISCIVEKGYSKNMDISDAKQLFCKEIREAYIQFTAEQNE